MLKFLFLPLLVVAEWVEISQNDYKKETNHRFTHFHQKNTDNYKNQTIVEHQWTKGYVQRMPGVTVKRLHEGESEPPEKNEGSPFHHHDLTTQEAVVKSEITQWKSGNALIERLDHRDVPRRNHYSTPAMKIHSLQSNSENTSKRKLNLHNNDDEVIKTKTLNSAQESHTDKNKFMKNQSLENPTRDVNGSYKDIHKIRDSNNEQYLKDDKFIRSGNKPKKKSTGNENAKEKIKVNAMETFMKILKVASQTINQSAGRSFNGKVRYLESLKDTLLGSIEEHIDSSFPDDNNEHQRHRRASGVESRGHVEFPSSESALMSISFLTFAVFLIKLVLQVIHTYKAKTMMVTPAVVATVGRAAAFIKKSTGN